MFLWSMPSYDLGQLRHRGCITSKRPYLSPIEKYLPFIITCYGDICYGRNELEGVQKNISWTFIGFGIPTTTANNTVTGAPLHDDEVYTHDFMGTLSGGPRWPLRQRTVASEWRRRCWLFIWSAASYRAMNQLCDHVGGNTWILIGDQALLTKPDIPCTPPNLSVWPSNFSTHSCSFTVEFHQDWKVAWCDALNI